MKEDIQEIIKETKENRSIPIHLRMTEFKTAPTDLSEVKFDRIKRVKSISLQTDQYFVFPFNKHISSF